MKSFLLYLFLHTDSVTAEGQISGTGEGELKEVWLRKWP
jgi:hypothetical protein